MNWGGFGAGFSRGFNDGVTMGKTFNQAMKEHQLQQIREQGLAEATAARNSEIDKLVQQNGVTGEPPAAPPQQKAPQQSAPLPMAEDPMTADQGPVAQAYPVKPQDAPEIVTPGGKPAATTPQAASATTPAAETPTPIVPVKPASEPAAAPSAAPASVSSVASDRGVAPAMPFTVNGKGYATREEARAAASKSVPSITDYVTNTIVPKLQEHYVANGEIDKAEQLQTYMESKRGRDATKQFGKAMTALLYNGDVNAGVQALGEYYNKYVDDGVDFTGGAVDPKDPNKISITVKRRGAEGESTISMTKAEIVRLGVAHDPAKLFQMGLTKIEKEEAAQAEVAKEGRQFQAKIKEEEFKQRGRLKEEEAKHGYRMKEEKAKQDGETEREGVRSELDAAKPGETEKKIRGLRKLGWSDERISSLLDKDGEYKKTTNPTERRALVVSDLIKNDPKFSGDSADVKERKINENMTLIYGSPSGPAPQSPAASGLPQPGAKKGVPWYNPATKKVEYR